MSTNNYIPQNEFFTTLLGIPGAQILEVSNKDSEILIDLEVEKKTQVCPECKEDVNRVHDRRPRKLNAGHFNGSTVTLNVRRRRFRCAHCGKRFLEDIPWMLKHIRMTKNQFMSLVCGLHGSTKSMKDIAKEHHVTYAQGRRILTTYIKPASEPLPKALGIDEFRGNAGGEKFQTILTNLEDNTVVDVLKDRKTDNLIAYFMDRPDRENVEIVVMDHSNLFRNVINVCFPNAQIVSDRFHTVRLLLWKMDQVRKREQNRLGKEMRLHFKHTKKIFYKRYDDLSEASRKTLAEMLSHSQELARAWYMKEVYYEIMDLRDEKRIRECLGKWIEIVEDFEIECYYSFVQTLRNWADPIVKSIMMDYSNGFTEGMNNKVKVIKRNGYCYTNFESLRTRIMMAANYKEAVA